MRRYVKYLALNILLIFLITDGIAQPYKHQRCSNRLENALEHMRRRSIQVKSSRSLWNSPESSPYQLYHSFYGPDSSPEDDFYSGGNGGGSFQSNIHAGGRGYYAKNINRNDRPYPTGDIDLEDLFSSSTTMANLRQPHKLAISRVDVEDLKVRVPPGKSATRWVEIDKCKFSTENSTLDTRLIFPDLTLSGKVVLQPAGGKCNMILRLRHAGIEFRTIPIGFETTGHEETRGRLGAASVRTDSHFAEPGFISVFAHGCQGPSGIRLRQNSKRRYGYAGGTEPPHITTPEVSLSEPNVILGTATTTSHRWGKLTNPSAYYRPNYDIRTESYLQQHEPQRELDLDFNSNEGESREFFDVNADNFYRRKFQRRRRRRDIDDGANRRRRQFYNNEDELRFDIFNFEDDKLQHLVQPDARAFADILGSGAAGQASDSEDFVNDALSGELEKLFSMGVRGLLTTYMQRALQPAIKETLMENMGYTLSYG